MSTIFGLYNKPGIIELVDDSLPIEYSADDFTEVAFRDSNGIMVLHHYLINLPSETLVYPLDNTAQGIYTIGDIKEMLEY
jgi:hypothetical protein